MFTQMRYSPTPEGLYHMATEDQNAQFISDLQKYTQLQSSLESVRARLKDIGEGLKNLGCELLRDPLLCSVEKWDWSHVQSSTVQVEGLLKQLHTESEESRTLAQSLKNRGYIFPVN